MQLFKENENDSVSITGDRAQVTIELPNKCRCLNNSSQLPPANIDGKNNDGNNEVVLASVLSVLVTVAVVMAALIILVIIVCRRRAKSLHLDKYVMNSLYSFEIIFAIISATCWKIFLGSTSTWFKVYITHHCAEIIQDYSIYIIL